MYIAIATCSLAVVTRAASVECDWDTQFENFKRGKVEGGGSRKHGRPNSKCTKRKDQIPVTRRSRKRSVVWEGSETTYTSLSVTSVTKE